MKLFKKTAFILIIFLKTGNLLSDNNLFNVNNIELEKKGNISSKQMADKAIKQGFDLLIKRVLMKEDYSKVSKLNLSSIKELVTYYNMSNNNEISDNKINFNILFDKDKLHNLFYKHAISYSDILDKEFYILPILINGSEISIFSKNYFYENWNKIISNELIEFILPLENIEIIRSINQAKDDLSNLDLKILFQEYTKKNVAIAIIENKTNQKKIYLKARIQEKKISKSFTFNQKELNQTNFNDQIISKTKNEIINLVKSQNLIDIRTPSFLNVRLNLDKKNNLILLNTRIKKITQIENIFVTEFNKDYVILKIKHLGKLEKIKTQLANQNINIQLINDQWIIKLM
tara:strand:+ start:2805 stop:3842 length:1038 start_codon:yes stop_codon:yes gene_type:complete